MKTLWDEEARDEYLDFAAKDKKTFNFINVLIKDIERNGVGVGRGRPEQLKHHYIGYWSRQIDEKNRLIYKLTDRGELEIRKCKDHYYDH